MNEFANILLPMKYPSVTLCIDGWRTWQAMVVIDSVVRLLPGVLGNDESAKQDSFSTNLLEHPHYTRPSDFRGHRVPDVLLSGHHQKIEDWREYESLKRTYERRPDLIDKAGLTDKQQKFLTQIIDEK